MEVPIASSAPARLDDLLQIPLKIIPLEDLLRENEGSAPSSLHKSKDGTGESQSCVSPRSLEGTASGKDGRLDCEKPKSSSSPCLFDCCSVPSRWNKTGIYSNNANFKSTAIKLPDGSTAIIPVMDYGDGESEETISDVEMRRGSTDVDERTIEEITLDDSPMSGSPSGDTQSVIKSEVLRASPPKSGSSGIAAVLGKVTENPTRFEDFLIAQDRSPPLSESNNNSYDSADNSHEIITNRNIIVSLRKKSSDEGNEDVVESHGRSSSSKRFSSVSEEEDAADNDTLKLTFYNDGRKQSVKEFRGNSREGAESVQTLEERRRGKNGEENEAEAENEVRVPKESQHYFENHGLELSRVLREVAQKETDKTSQVQDKGQGNNYTSNDNDSDTQCPRPRPHSRAARGEGATDESGSTSISSNSDNNRINSWEQWKGLQISRCQRELPDKSSYNLSPKPNNKKSPSPNKEDNGVDSSLEKSSDRHTPAADNTISQREREDKGESETALIDKHLQSVLSSFRYVKPKPVTRESPSETESSDKTCITPKVSTVVSPITPTSLAPVNRRGSGGTPSPVQNPRTLFHAEVERRDGIVAITSQAQSILREPGLTKKPIGSKVIISEVPSPTTLQQQQNQLQQQQHSDTSHGKPLEATWPERTIARIPTRPYLLKNVTYEQPPPRQQHQQTPVQPPHQQHQRIPLNSYNQSQQYSNSPQQKHHAVMVANPSPPSSGLHEMPKRFKPNPPINSPSTLSQHHVQQQMQQQQYFNLQQPRQSPMQNANRYPINHNKIPVANISHHAPQAHLPTPIPPQLRVSSVTVSPSSSENRGSITTGYVNVQHPQYQHNHHQQRPLQHPHQYQQHSQANLNPSSPYGAGAGRKSPAGSTVRLPYQSPLGQEQVVTGSQNLPNTNRWHESLMIAAAVAANAASSNHSDYYDRLRAYYEYYQNQQLDEAKLAEYYQKFQMYPWEAVSSGGSGHIGGGQEEPGLIRQWRTDTNITNLSHQPQPQKRIEERSRIPYGKGHEIESIAQHQLALRAMEAAGVRGTNINPMHASQNQIQAQAHHTPIESHSYNSNNKEKAHLTPANIPSNVGFHGGRTMKVVNISPPQASPTQPHPANTQQQQFHQLRQMQERQYHQNQMLQQQQQQQQQHGNIIRYHQELVSPPQQQVGHVQTRHVYHQPPVAITPQQHHNMQQTALQQQQQQYNQSQIKIHHRPAPVAVAPTYHDIQSNPNYRSAYNQLAAAAVAVAASAGNNQRSSVIDAGHGNHQLRPMDLVNSNNGRMLGVNQHNNLSHINHERDRYPVRNNNSNINIQSQPSSYHRTNLNLNVNPPNNPPDAHTTATINIAPTPRHNSPPASFPIGDAAPFMPNIHRQTLELAIKNNFKGGSTNTISSIMAAQNNRNNGNNNNNNMILTKSTRPVSISPPLPHPQQGQPLSHQLSIRNSAGESPKNIIINEVPRIGGLNMTKEPLRTASSPTLVQQTSVIRRVQPQPQRISPSSNTANNRAFPIITPNHQSQQHQTKIQSVVVDNRSGNSNTPFYNRNPDNYESNIHNPNQLQQRIISNHNGSLYAGNHERIIKRRINVISNHSNDDGFVRGRDHPRRTHSSSPIRLIAGEEEVIGENVSPSNVLATINPVNEGDGATPITIHRNNSKADDEELESHRDDGVDDVHDNRINHNSEGGGSWHYDHVVLLDKRTKTYMCKRCFETLKTEQEIRNHLFCKMLAGHVRCYVCLQLLTVDKYPDHLRIHGSRPETQEVEEK